MFKNAILSIFPQVKHFKLVVNLNNKDFNLIGSIQMTSNVLSTDSKLNIEITNEDDLQAAPTAPIVENVQSAYSILTSGSLFPRMPNIKAMIFKDCIIKLGD